ncbi:MAG TPA: hypothetical protein ENI23_02700 [bacterium]|nr:hypothetical protein [bacterium]
MDDTNVQNNQPQDPQMGQQGDDSIPSFLNDPSLAQDPAVVDQLAQGQLPPGQIDQDGTDPSSQQVVVGTGVSPEAPGVVAPVETAPQAPEYQADSLKQPEVPPIEQVEKKEADAQVQKPDISAKPTIAPKTVEKEQDISGPKIYGYMVPNKIRNNFRAIKSKKGKGNPSASRTWLYVLLDRMLRMHSDS